MWIKTLPVYSKLADPAEVPPEIVARQPEGLQLSQHQMETYQALTKGDADVIFNTAMTGDGKSLAGQLPVLIHGGKHLMMAMYPTNELIHDQRGQLRLAIANWGGGLSSAQINGARLDDLTAEDALMERGDALMHELRNHDVVLTNPDIFHYIMHQFYLYQDDARDKIIGPLMQRIKQFTFDEFHIFDVPQVISVLNALLFIDEIGGDVRLHRYLFLSATPGKLMLEYLHRSGLVVQEIEGQYCHSETPLDSAQWRRILHAATIHVAAGRVEEWITQHLEDTLLPFFLERGPHAKGAIIVNSVAAAHRLLNILQPVLAQHGLTVEPNTGLTSRARRAASYEADLLIGTSTVDVGVDFQINFLLFESRDGGSFLQRLGRLGRHDDYTRNGQTYAFRDFEAYALIPPWIEEALFKGRDGAAPLLEPEMTVDRERFNDAIREAYPRLTSFDAYARLWGELQTIRVMGGLSHKTIREQYKEARIRLGQRYEQTFGIRLNAAYARRKELQETQRKLLDEAESFRGGSYFNCCLIDEMEEGADQFKIADLFQVLANADLARVDEDDFYAAAEQQAGRKRSAFERQEPLAFYRLCGWREEREDYRIVLDRDIRGWGAERFGRAQVLKGFRVLARVPGINAVNNRLSRRAIPALLCLGFHPLELKRRLRLPLLFGIHAFESRDGVQGCVAFGREALLLEARLAHSGLDCGGGAMIV
jgi:CRISPR-associated endonuclease/helicase Cas3